MTEFLAIVVDTWRQSKQQVVFLILCVMVAILAFIMIAYPKIHVSESGEKQFGLQFQDDPVSWPEEMWVETYAESLLLKRGQSSALGPRGGEDDGREKTRTEARAEARERAQEISSIQRSVEVWVFIAAYAIFTLSMLFFIGACASYYPDMLGTGAVDVVVSKPLTRLQIYLGKYLGGLVLYTVVISAAYLVIMTGLGLRTGVWHTRIFQAIPLQVFAAGVLYAIVGLLGVMFRSTAFAVIVGYIFYLVIDTAVSTAAEFQQMGVSEHIPVLDRFMEACNYLPSFVFLREAAVNSCMSLPHMESRPLIVAGVWLLITLSLGFWKFRRTDF